jgi:hypothetical protein
MILFNDIRNCCTKVMHHVGFSKIYVKSTVRSFPASRWGRCSIARFICLILCLTLVSQTALAQPGSQEFSGNGTFTVPAGVTNITVEVWGAGGGGGGRSGSNNTTARGGGGGAYARSVLQVSPGDSFAIEIGQGGTGGVGTNNGQAGGASSFGAEPLVSAAGGAAGTSSTSGAGGAGGAIAASIGQVVYRGGNANSGGGGAAGTSGNGGDTAGSTGGIGTNVDGGDGGSAPTSGTNDGNPGLSFGGGGSGGRRGGTGSATGGSGANGFIRVSYTTCSVAGQGDCTYIVTEAGVDYLVEEFTRSGTHNFTLPGAVAEIQVEAWGAGGGGGGRGASDNTTARGGGGGAYARSVLTLTSGSTHTLSVGAGGTGGVGTAAGANGSLSSFGAGPLVRAAGGTGGSSATSGVGGSGGTTAASLGQVLFRGGDANAGGGGGAGSTGAGGDTASNAGGLGTADDGGIGGTAPATASNGSVGVLFGGGGSGARRATSGSFNGGAGAAGKITIRYEVPITCLSSGQGDCTYSLTENGVEYIVERYSNTGTSGFTPPVGVQRIEYLIVAGGGPGGTGTDRTSGGGGAGGLLAGVTNVPQSALTVTVGAGGTNNTNGGNSVFDSLTAIGGGAGGRGAPYVNGQAGGSGGGGQHNAASVSGSGTAGQGNPGGEGYDSGNVNQAFAAGGGGGAGAAGGSATVNPTTGTAGSGGSGILSSISGLALYYSGGGGGGAQTDQVAYLRGPAGQGGGGAGGRATVTGAQVRPGAPGLVNTGGGGGGGSSSGTGALTGGAGGSGVVLLRYTLPEFEIVHASGYGLCSSFVPVTITIRDGLGNAVTNYTGTITVANSANTGSYTIGTGAGTLTPTGAGTATYQFNSADNGQVVLRFSTTSVTSLSFNVIDSVNNIQTSSSYNLVMQTGACEFRIFHAGTSNVCSQAPVTIQVVGPNAAIVTGYTGNVSISTVGSTGGNWSKTSTPADALGTLTPGTPNTGAATYSFVAADQGQVILNFQDNAAETVNFQLVAANVAQPSGIYDPDLVISACTFRITHSGASDICSIAQVTITLVDAGGNTVSGYTGTINLSTTTGFGSWVTVGLSAGTLFDPVNEDGAATYTFVPADSGTITLGFRHSSNSGPVNINVSDGVSQDPRNSASSFDQNIVVSLCTFEISHGLNSNACQITDVTFTVRNSTGGIATDYIGTMRITNNTNRGDWQASPTMQGTLSAPSGPDVGLSDYTFNTNDNGVVTLRFVSGFPAVINFNVVDGLLVENGAFDPNLFYSGCFPQIFGGPACTNPGTSTSVAIPAQNALPQIRSRMVLMATMQIGNSSPATTATFNGVNMTRVVRMENDDQAPGMTTEIWAIFDNDLPAAAGTYTGVFSGGVGLPAICLISVTGVDQVLPVPAANPEFGPVNSSKFTGPVVGGRHDALTRITTTANNSFIFSVAANDADAASTSFYYWRPPSPAASLTGLWGGTATPNPNTLPQRGAILRADAQTAGGDLTRTAGSAGVQPAASLIEIIEPFQSGTVTPPTMNAHVVAAFKPLVAGSPLADDYVPVILYETYSGAMSYRAIGNSLRTEPSTTTLTVDPVVDCAMVNFATGTTATLNVPVGATIVDAYLYWAGSGTLAQADTQVSFGPDNNEVAVTAEELFMIEGVTTSANDFFAGYAKVTPLVTGSGTYRLKDLTVQTGAPWTSNGTCTGGWALVVVYEHPNEHLRVINLFHGFQPFQYSAFTLVPRNFRMATYNASQLLPNGQVTHVTLEGDEQLSTGDESLGIQTAPNATTFTVLPNSYNPATGEYNSTVTRPLYALGPTGYFEFQAGTGLNSDGYEIDFPGVNVVEAGRTGNRIGSTWGLDIDTHYLSHTLLQPFAQLGQEAEQITTRYSSGQDLVLLLSEVISIANFPIADMEVFVEQSGTFKVNGTGSYEINVVNNGNGTSIGGQATGEVIVAVTLPAGLTFDDINDVGGSGWVCSVTLSPGAFTCVYDIASTWAGGELANGDSLPTITANVLVGGPTQFPLLNNTAPLSVRMLHSGGDCTPVADGLIPDPASCDRAPQFDNRNDLQGDTISINTLFDKSSSNNNVDRVITNIRGLETNLRMQKTIAEALEAGSTGQYLLTVTNLGPDATTVPFTLTDIQPTGVLFTAASGAGWSCATITPTLSCTFAGSLALNASTSLVLDVDVVGGINFNVTNTALVTAGAGNFDTVPGNNSATNITAIVGPPVASQERFLMSVSTPGNSTSIGGLSNFENHDLIIYDPATDEAIMFFDDSLVNGGRIDDINAVHLLKNGHIILSANDSSEIGSNNIAFEPWDLVRYDPILGTASVFLDGSTVFSSHEDVNINGVYVLDDCPGSTNSLTCSVLLTTTTGGVAGTNNLAFTASDIIIIYRSGPNIGQAAIYLEGSDADVFGAADGNGNVNVDAFYLRVDPNNPTGVIDTFVLSVDNETAIIGAAPGMDPVTGTIFSRDDVTQLDRTGDTTENLFVGDEVLGVFDPVSADRRINALHLVEDGYIGHFSIRQEQSGTVCEAGVIRISKHEGLTHNRDTDYYGSVRISTSTSYGTWQLQQGNGVLTQQSPGLAIYTYVPSDQGTVVLRLVHDQEGTVNVNVTNGLAKEIGSEDPNFAFNEVLTQIIWRDLFNIAAFSNSDGSRAWGGSWNELDAIDGTVGGGLGATTGNVQVVSGRLRMTSSLAAVANSLQPSLFREFDLDAVPFTEDVVLNIRYGHTALAASDSFVIEARGSSADNWVILQNFTGITADQTNSSIPVSYNLTTLLGAANQSFSATTAIQFRINNGYELERYFFIDDVEIVTATDQCGFGGAGALDHFAISHAGFGIACVGTPITITAHDAAHDPIDADGETVNLSISPAKGVWARILSGNGTLTPIGSQLDNGIASYTFGPGEQAVTLLLNYTVPAGAVVPVNINTVGAVSGAVELEDPTLQIAEAGLRFYNETLNNTTIATQIAGKPSNVLPLNHLLTLQAVRSADDDPQQCVPLFDAGQTLRIGLAAECKDPTTCQGTETFFVNGDAVALVNDNAAASASSYSDVELEFEIQPSGDPGATLVLQYSDVGLMQLHARFDIPFGFFGSPSPDDPLTAPGYSGDLLLGSSNDFVVRPFGFAIDFPGADGLDRAEGIPADNFPDRNAAPANSFAADSAGTVFVQAGEGFDTVVTAMAWQAADDADQDGFPDAGANLHDNRPTPNFYLDSEGVANDYRVRLNVESNQAQALGGVLGTLTNDILDFSSFDNYAVLATGQTNLVYNEVGIINLMAEMIDGVDDPVTYLGTEVIRGRVADVGRFYPQRFDVTTADFLSRFGSNCAPPSSFTYLDEPFGVSLVLVARNVQGQPTVNYRGAFAKLADYVDLNFRLIEEVVAADNTNLSSRLDNVDLPVNLQPVWSTVTGGSLILDGRLAFARATPADPDGPFEDIILAFVPIDSDGVTLDVADLDTEIIEAQLEFSEIARHEFRYGRLIINNAYGPETEDLAITLRVEYFDGERFILNLQDSCTAIDAAEVDLLAGTYTGNLADGDTDIVTPLTPTFHLGQIQGVQSAVNPTDATLTATAPGENNGGTVDVEIDLDAIGLPFLQFKWPHVDVNFNENPRAQLEFGQFRSHDRVIHWQEIYRGPTTP